MLHGSIVVLQRKKIKIAGNDVVIIHDELKMLIIIRKVVVFSRSVLSSQKSYICGAFQTCKIHRNYKGQFILQYSATKL